MARGPFDKGKLQEIGKQFVRIIQQTEEDRNQLLQKTWSRAEKNYEGKASIKVFPWPYASNAVLNQTAAYSDDLSARLYNAATAHDPIFLVTTPEPLGDLTPEEASDILQDLSRYVERHLVRYPDVLEEAIPTFVIFGDTWLCPAWDTDEYKVYKYNPDTGEEEPNTVKKNQPCIRVFHPSATWIPTYAQDEEKASWVGYSFELDELLLRNYIAREIYDSKAGEKLLKILGTDSSKAEAARTYYREYKGKVYSSDEYDKIVKQQEGRSADSSGSTLEMVHIFAAVDVDGDGVPEEINFHMHRETGIIPFIEFSRPAPKRRPLYHMYFSKRTGSPYNRGAAELLSSTQKIINTLVRDLLDNNKVQNTKMFLARKGANFDRTLRAYPGRVLFVESLENDFKPIDMGTGQRLEHVVEMVSLAQQWGERAVGITESNLGREGKSRTPFGTTLTLMQEGGKRADRIIDRMREVMKNLHYHVLALVLEHGDPTELAEAAGIDPGKLLRIWGQLTPEKLVKQIGLVVDISTSSWNRSLQQQTWMALYSQVDAHVKRMVELGQLMAVQGSDPAFRKLLVEAAQAGQYLMRQLVNTYDDLHFPDKVLPDYAPLLEAIQNVQVEEEPAAGGEAGRSSSPKAAAQLVGGPGGAPAQAATPGRPPAGLARPTGGLAGLPG